MSSSSKLVNRKRLNKSPLSGDAGSQNSLKTALETIPPSASSTSGGDNGDTEQQNSDDTVTHEDDNGFLSRHPGLVLLLIFLSYVLLLYLVYLAFPTLEPHERKHVKLPWDMKEAKALAVILERYKEDHYWTVFIGFALVFLFLQSFAIPGSIFLSIMSGFLFSFSTALILVCFCSATGASCCYTLSWLVGQPLVEAYFSDVVRQWTEKVNEERENLLNFIVFLRITPILPNWLINIVAPHIGVPLKVFWAGTLIGVAPPSFLAVQAGRTLNMMTSPSDQFSWTAIIILAGVAVFSLIPVIYRRMR